VMTPWEVRCHFAFITGEAEPHPKLEAVLKRLDRFADGWAALWARFGAGDAGLPEYRRLIADTRGELERFGAKEVRLKNGLDLPFVVDQLVFLMAVPEQAAPTAQARIAS